MFLLRNFCYSDINVFHTLRCGWMSLTFLLGNNSQLFDWLFYRRRVGGQRVSKPPRAREGGHRVRNRPEYLVEPPDKVQTVCLCFFFVLVLIRIVVTTTFYCTIFLFCQNFLRFFHAILFLQLLSCLAFVDFIYL